MMDKKKRWNIKKREREMDVSNIMMLGGKEREREREKRTDDERRNKA